MRRPHLLQALASRLAAFAAALALFGSALVPASEPEPAAGAPAAPATPSPAAAESASPPPGGAPVELAVRSGSSVSYHLVHTLHDVVGVSPGLDGRVRLSPSGAVEVRVRARIDGFDSGNGSRDEKMREVTDAARFPFVVLEASGTFAPPATYPATLDLTVDGELTFHGVGRRVSVPVRATFTGPTSAIATATFPISLASFGVVPPSLLFLKIQDRAEITAKVVLEADAP